jgi:uncharacterized protein YqeY
MSEQTIDAKITGMMKDAMRAKDKPSLQVIRMVKASLQDLMNKPDGPKEATDKVWQDVIAAYIKRVGKAADEYRKVGEKGEAKLVELQFEVDFLKPFLPAMIEGAELDAIVDAAIAEIGATSQKEVGRVMGAIMKNHKGKVDSKQVKEIISGKLGE